MINGMEQRDRLLTVQELANYLDVPVATLYQWRYRREGPLGFRVGRHVRYRWCDVQEWIEHQVKAAPTQPTSHLTSTVVSGGRSGPPSGRSGRKR
jgi:excisionase family DNA binding protein